jgi:hypothetical protein
MPRQVKKLSGEAHESILPRLSQNKKEKRKASQNETLTIISIIIQRQFQKT